MEQLWHGPQLDEAMDGDDSGPAGMGVCLTALDTRTKGVIDEQLENFKPGSEMFEETKAMLLKQGAPFDDELVMAVCLRSAIGASFTYGVATGLRLAKLPKTTTPKED